ncbi:S41 family peptidase [Winogradskyella sp. UBA3174]|uniref:S41 family peptidase n=1 Tax=Winogradskyella sp. UBA3174 TaxID=1947785 RepID=UPI0025FEC479|nr:S41 family peptidase [Winogradskyella sp. UBA3174]|tara:strand:+ start:3057 stop:4646 length:1590 start_codon:yes stop_codon:yes gene_type:complete
MKKFLLLFSVAMVFASCASVEKYNTQVTKLHSVEDIHEDIDKVYNQLQRLHPRLYQFNSKETLDYKFDSLKKAITKPITSRTFYKKLAAVTKYVGQGHMSVSPPSKKLERKERSAFNLMKFDINNLDFEYVDNKLIISKAKGDDSLLVNAEVLKIGDNTTQYLMNTYKKRVASDGYNTTFYNRVIGKRILRYYSYDVGRFDSLKITFRNLDSTFVKNYKRIAKVKIKDSLSEDSIKVIKPKVKLTKAERKAKKLKWKKERKERRKYGYDYATKENIRDLSFTGKDSTVALLKIKGFKNGKFEAFYDETFTILDSLKTKTLIIDLRNNFGGRLNEIDYLYSYLTDKNFTFINKSEINTRFPVLKSLMSNSKGLGVKLFVGLLSPGFAVVDILRVSKKDGQLYYKFKSAKEQEANPLNFKGKIYVLINGNSFSASSILATQLKGSKRATFVGEETGGAYNGTVAGLFKVYELPNTMVRARIGLMHIDSKYNIEPDGYGVKPDIEILPTYQDRLNNVDPELEWVLKAIEKKK